MAQLSVSDIAVAGFRVARHKPVTIVVWAVASLAMSLVTAGLMLTMGGAAMTQSMAMAMNPQALEANPGAMMALYAQLAPLYGALILISLAYYAVLLPAAYRAVLRPQESAFGYLRFGADEGRQLIVNIVLGLVMIVVYFGSVILMALIVAITAFAGDVGAVIGTLLGIVALLGSWFYVAVRLSLAGPQTLAERRLRLFGSWALTKGRFWPLFGGYVVAVLLSIVVTILGLVIVFAASAVIGGGMQGLSAVFRPDMSSASAYFTPLMILHLVMMSVVSSLGTAILLCPAAEAYNTLTNANEIEVF
jgi:hypothetical protein